MSIAGWTLQITACTTFDGIQMRPLDLFSFLNCALRSIRRTTDVDVTGGGFNGPGCVRMPRVDHFEASLRESNGAVYKTNMDGMGYMFHATKKGLLASSSTKMCGSLETHDVPLPDVHPPLQQQRAHRNSRLKNGKKPKTINRFRCAKSQRRSRTRTRVTTANGFANLSHPKLVFHQELSEYLFTFVSSHAGSNESVHFSGDNRTPARIHMNSFTHRPPKRWCLCNLHEQSRQEEGR